MIAAFCVLPLADSAAPTSECERREFYQRSRSFTFIILRQEAEILISFDLLCGFFCGESAGGDGNEFLGQHQTGMTEPTPRTVGKGEKREEDAGIHSQV